MSSENSGFKEVNNLNEVKETLDEIRKSWEEICDAFEVSPDLKIDSKIIRSSVRMTLVELNDLENLDYVRKSTKPLEKLHETYVKALIKFAYSTVDGEESSVWRDEVDSYIKSIFTEDILADMDIKVKNDESVTLDMLIDDVNRILSIANQLNVIKGMESGNFTAEPFVGLINNFSYLGIGIVQTCNGNAVVMGEVITFLKVLIKTNDIILKQITDMIMGTPRD
ncbi:MAG: hypothetical protein ACLRVQ_09105 [Lachnospiraceae bacterium]